MIAMQAQLENFATALELMHDTVSTCQVVLGQVVKGELWILLLTYLFHL